jgi:hypothetical protein
VYVLNRTLSKSNGNKTPYEWWTGSKPTVSHLRVFGCIAHVKVAKPNMQKLEDRSQSLIFVGYEPGFAAYRCYNPSTKHVHISRDVVFDEEGTWDWLGDQAEGLDVDFVIEGQSDDMHLTVSVWKELDANKVLKPAAEQQETGGTHLAEEGEEYVSQPPLDHHTPQAGGAATPFSGTSSRTRTPPSENLDANHDEDAPLRYKHLLEINGPSSPLGQAARQLQEQLFLVAGEEPTTYR